MQKSGAFSALSNPTPPSWTGLPVPSTGGQNSQANSSTTGSPMHHSNQAGALLPVGRSPGKEGILFLMFNIFKNDTEYFKINCQS